MADNSVVVATYIYSYEAELAKNLLESRGISSFLTGGSMAGMAPLLDTFRLEVHSDDAPRASAILAAHEAQVSLDEDWEDKAESGAGVWTCSVCGEPVSESMPVCFACSTPRDAIRTDNPHTLLQAPRRGPPADGIQSDSQAAGSKALAVPTDATVAEDAGETDGADEKPPITSADLLAQRALITAFIGWLLVLLVPLAWWHLTLAFTHLDELSPRGRRRFFTALVFNGLVVAFYAPIFFLVARAFRTWR